MTEGQEEKKAIVSGPAADCCHLSAHLACTHSSHSQPPGNIAAAFGGSLDPNSKMQQYQTPPPTVESHDDVNTAGNVNSLPLTGSRVDDIAKWGGTRW